MLAYREKHHSLIARDLSHIEEYTKEDLMKTEKIELIYRMMYRYDIHITKSGWEFLIEQYGYEGLYEIDKSCECFHTACLKKGKNDGLKDYIEWINDRIKAYPEVPDYVYKDHRPKNIAKTALRVRTVEEVAELFEMSVECVQELYRQVQEEQAEYEQKQRKKLVPYYLKESKTAEKIAEELDLDIDYVREVESEMKESRIKSEKLRKTINALRTDKVAEEIAKEMEMPLELVLELERKIRR